MASYGILAITIDVSFLSASIGSEEFGESGQVAGGAIILLEHLKQLRLWNEQTDHPLEGKVNPEKCIIIGHSHGGEAVGHASLINRKKSPIQFYKDLKPIDIDGLQGLGPYKFGIQTVVALAPTDQLYQPPKGPILVPDNYLVIQGSRDEGIFSFDGYLTYDRSHPLNSNSNTSMGFKSLLWIHEANHSFFDSLAEQDPSPVKPLSRETQEKILKVYISALAQAQLLSKKEYLQLLKDHRFGVNQGWLPEDVTYISQYQSPNRLLIQHFEECVRAYNSLPKLSSLFNGTVTFSGISAQVQPFYRVVSSDEEPSVPKCNRKCNRKGEILDQKYHLYQDTHGLRIDWTVPGGQYVLTFNSPIQAEKFDSLAFRIGQSFESNNAPGKVQDLTLIVYSKTHSFCSRLSSLQTIPYPDDFCKQGSVFEGSEPATILQTVFLPFYLLRTGGVDPLNLTKLEFIFDVTHSGTVYIDNIQLTNIEV